MSKSAEYHADLAAAIAADINARADRHADLAAHFAADGDEPRLALHAIQADYWLRLAPAADGWRTASDDEEFVLGWLREQNAPKLAKIGAKS